MTILGTVLGVAALVMLLPVGDRMRQMNFRTHRATVVVLYLVAALTCLGTAWTFLFDGSVQYWAASGLVLVTLLLVNTRPTWKNGPPDYTSRPPQDHHEVATQDRGTPT